MRTLAGSKRAGGPLGVLAPAPILGALPVRRRASTSLDVIDVTSGL
jgi:hypothetical protein